MQSTPEPSTDDDIIREILNGNKDAFETIIDRYGPAIVTLLKRHVPAQQVEDMAQETFIRAYQSLASFKQKDRLKAWLSAIAIRTCYDHWRKHYRSRETAGSDLSEAQEHWLKKAMAEQANHSFEALARKQEARETLDWALSRLSPEDRMVVELVYLEELPVKEAARLLGWSVANVKIRSFRSRNKLQTIIHRQVTQK